MTLKSKSCMIIVGLAFFAFILLNHLNTPVASALDIREMAARTLEFNAGSEKVEINSYFFFQALGKQFDKQIQNYNSVDAIPVCLNDGRVFGGFAQYANLSYLAEEQLFDEVLRNSYGIFSDFPRNQSGRPLKNDSLRALYAVFQNITQYHAIKSGVSRGSEKAVESDIQSWLRYFFNSAAQANPSKTNYLSDRDKNGLIEFISDYDYFVMQYYESLRNQYASPPADGNLVMSVGFLKSSY